MESTRFGDVSLPLTLAAKISDGSSLCKMSSSRVWGTSGSAVCVDSHRLRHIYLRLIHSLQVYGFASIFTEFRTQILANFLKILYFFGKILKSMQNTEKGEFILKVREQLGGNVHASLVI